MRTGSKAGNNGSKFWRYLNRSGREYRGSLWPLLLIVFVLAGAIDIAAHLQHW